MHLNQSVRPTHPHRPTAPLPRFGLAVVAWSLLGLVLALLPPLHAESPRTGVPAIETVQSAAIAAQVPGVPSPDPTRHRHAVAKKPRAATQSVPPEPVPLPLPAWAAPAPPARVPVALGFRCPGDCLRPDPALRLHPAQAPPRAA